MGRTDVEGELAQRRGKRHIREEGTDGAGVVHIVWPTQVVNQGHRPIIIISPTTFQARIALTACLFWEGLLFLSAGAPYDLVNYPTQHVGVQNSRTSSR